VRKWEKWAGDRLGDVVVIVIKEEGDIGSTAFLRKFG
jgi:hypothetical protein